MQASPENDGVLHPYATLGMLESLDFAENFLFVTQKAEVLLPRYAGASGDGCVRGPLLNPIC